jgi:hypothetical protein
VLSSYPGSGSSRLLTQDPKPRTTESPLNLGEEGGERNPFYTSGEETKQAQNSCRQQKTQHKNRVEEVNQKID